DLHQHTAHTLLRQDATLYREDVRVANLGRQQPLAKSSREAGGASCRTLRAAQAAGAGRRAPGVGWAPCHPPTPAETAAAVERACPRACACAPTSAPPVGESWTATSTRPALS